MSRCKSMLFSEMIFFISMYNLPVGGHSRARRDNSRMSVCRCRARFTHREYCTCQLHLNLQPSRKRSAYGLRTIHRLWVGELLHSTRVTLTKHEELSQKNCVHFSRHHTELAIAFPRQASKGCRCSNPGPKDQADSIKAPSSSHLGRIPQRNSSQSMAANLDLVADPVAAAVWA